MGLLGLSCGIGEAAKFFLDQPHEMQCVELLRLEICGVAEAGNLRGFAYLSLSWPILAYLSLS